MGKKKIWILPLILIALISLNFVLVSAADVQQADVQQALGKTAQTFKDFFSSWTDVTQSANTAKLIFGLIIATILFLIIWNLFGAKEGFMIPILILSLAISFLFTVYIAPEEVYALLNSYTAAGLAIITLIPLAVLAILSWQAVESGKPQIMILQWLLWVLYGIYLVYRVWLTLGEGSKFVDVTLVITALVAIGMIFLNKPILGFVAKRYVQEEKKAAERRFKEAGEALKNLSNLEKGAGI